LPAFAPYRGSVTACPGRGPPPASRPPAADRAPSGQLRVDSRLAAGRSWPPGQRHILLPGKRAVRQPPVNRSPRPRVLYF